MYKFNRFKLVVGPILKCVLVIYPVNYVTKLSKALEILVCSLQQCHQNAEASIPIPVATHTSTCKLLQKVCRSTRHNIFISGIQSEFSGVDEYFL